MSEGFKQFQAVFPEEACLDALMRARYGGSSMACTACGRPSVFKPRPKLRAFACGHCGYMIRPGEGTPFDSRRTPLQLWFFALKLLDEQGGKAAAGLIARQARVPDITARRLVEQLAALDAQKLDWFDSLRRRVCGERTAPRPAAAVEVAARPEASAADRAPATPALGSAPIAARGWSRRMAMVGLVAGTALIAAAVLGVALIKLRQEAPPPEP
jgi:predicted RNA-binding Zn-ribbon protein involved in translation (DUF1610 family)